MSYKRKTSSLSQSSGSDLSDAGKELELLATKKHKKSYAYSSDESKSSSKSASRSKSRSGSGSDSGTARSRSASRSKSRSGSRGRSSSRSQSEPEERKRSSSGSDSGTGGSHRMDQSPENIKRLSEASLESSGSEKNKRLLKASDRKPSYKLQSAINEDLDSDNDDDQRQKKTGKKYKTGNKNITESWREEFDDGLDSDLVGDDDDRDALEEMTEKQREEELFRRAERREELRKRYEISNKLRLQNKERKTRSSSSSSSEQSQISRSKADSDKGLPFMPTEARRKGYEEKHAAKFSALSNLKAAREEKERKEKERLEKEAKSRKKKKHSGAESGSDDLARSKKKMKASDIYSSSSSGGEENERRRSSSSSSSSSSVSSVSSGESDTERHKSNKVVKKAKTIESKEDLEKSRLSRFKIDKFVHLPIFKRTVVGCYVRIGIGQNTERNIPVYRIAEITDVCETAKIYNVMNTRTNIGLKLRHGKHERVFRAQFISNSPFTDSEFSKWKQTCETEHVELPTIQHCEDKAESIRKALTYRYSSADVDKILASKEKFSKHPHNYAMTKAKLQKEREQHLDAGNHEQVEKLDQKLAELEERAEELDRKRTSSIATISLINDRNRKNNILRAEKDIKSEAMRLKLEGHFDDPFTRRKTAPTLSMPKSKDLAEEDEMTTEKLLQLEQEKKRKKEEQLKALIDREAAITEVTSHKKDKKDSKSVTGSEDIFNAHDFDIDINVSEMADNSIPTSIALKPVTTSSSSSTGPTRRSIKIEEYKKKRGII